MSSRPSVWSSTVVSTREGSPTKPRSICSSPFGSSTLPVRSSLMAETMLPSLPQRPIALPPSALMKPTICLLIEPHSTISTISIVARSVIRKPFENCDSMPSFLSMAPICGPPPCTTTGLTPDCSSRTMSRAKLRADMFVAHGVAAVFHDHHRVVVAQHVRQGLHEHLRLFLGSCPFGLPSWFVPLSREMMSG